MWRPRVRGAKCSGSLGWGPETVRREGGSKGRDGDQQAQPVAWVGVRTQVEHAPVGWKDGGGL